MTLIICDFVSCDDALFAKHPIISLNPRIWYKPLYSLLVLFCKYRNVGLSYHQCTWMHYEIGAPYNGLASYPSKFQIQFPKIPKKRRTHNRKSLNTHITSFVITKNGVPQLLAPEDDPVHPCASNTSSKYMSFKKQSY